MSPFVLQVLKSIFSGDKDSVKQKCIHSDFLFVVWPYAGAVEPSVENCSSLNLFLACQHVPVRPKCGLKCVPQQAKSDGSQQDRIRSEFIFDFSVYLCPF